MATLVQSNSSGQNERIVLGNAAIKNIAKIKSFISSHTAANPYATLRENGVLSGYIVPAGKKLVIVGGNLYSTVSTTDWALGYADTDVGLNVGAPGINWTGNIYLNSIAAATPTATGILFVIPENKYPGAIFATGGVAEALFYGYEIDQNAVLL